MKIFKGLALVSVVTLAACAQPELPKDHYYRLQVQVPQVDKDAVLFKGTIEVGEAIAATI